MKPFTKWISIISLVAAIALILTGCGHREVPTPSGVTAMPGNGQVTIAWTAQTDATSYNIYWSTTPGVTTTSGTKITGATSPYIHSGLTNGTTYYYVVTSVNKDGESAPSSEVSATLGQPAPTGVTATPGNGQITIAWTAEADATSYNIYWSTTPGVTTTSGTKIAGVASPHIHSGLTNGTTYYYVVTAASNDGESAPSSEVSAIPSAVPAPAAPTDVTATPGNGQVTIAWTTVTGATSFNIYWSTTPGVTAANGTKITGVGSPYIHSGLINDTTYYYVVTAVNNDGESTPSSQVSAIPSVAPFIRATVLSVTGGTNPFGWLQQVSVCIDSTCNTAIPDATVTINGSILTYDAVRGQYRGNLAIAPGGVIDLKVTLGVNTINTYSLLASQFSTSPAPAVAATWLRTNANTISWTTDASTAATAHIAGIMNVSGNVVYPSPAGEVRNGFLEVPIDTNTFTVPANSLTTGNFHVFTGIATRGISINAPGTGIAIPGALSGSGLWVGLISSFMPITVI